MEHLEQLRKQFISFDLKCDFFWLVDLIQTPFNYHAWSCISPRAKLASLVVNIVIALQVFCATVQLCLVMQDETRNVDRMVLMFDQEYIFLMSIVRLGFVIYHRKSIETLKKYINSKVCLRNNAEAFELRSKNHGKNLKFVALFQFIACFNTTFWIFACVLKVDDLKIPFVLDYLPKSVGFLVKTIHGLVFQFWPVVFNVSLMQFGVILSCLHTELDVILLLFKDVQRKVKLCCVEKSTISNNQNRTRTDHSWHELKEAFDDVLTHHSAFVRNFNRFKAIASTNLLCLLASTPATVILNLIMFLNGFLLERVTLLLFAIMTSTEIFIFCLLLDRVQTKNNEIAEYASMLDWFYCSNLRRQGKSAKAILQNGLFLQAQLNTELTVKAGNTIPVNFVTFAEFIKLVYSVVTFCFQTFF